MNFTLDSGTEVQVSKTTGNTYSFVFTGPQGTIDNFTYTDDNRTKEEKESALNFNQLNALRIFWLKREEVV